MPDIIRIEHNLLINHVSKTLISSGLPPDIAQIEAQIMTEADLFGVPSHGVRMLAGLIQGIKNGQVNVKPTLPLISDNAATCVLNGECGPGRYISVKAMAQAVQRAENFGVGICLLVNATHWGRAHAYAYRAAQAGKIGICATNTMSNMLSYGSNQPLLGNNPLAIGIPRFDHDSPIVLDMAMSQAALGKIATYQRLGKQVPPNWGLDNENKSTTDPAAILASGKVLPFGEYKGSGLSLALEMLTAALAQGRLCFEIAKNYHGGMETGTSKLFLAIAPSAFGPIEGFYSRVDDMLSYLHQSATLGQEILYPGERGWRARTTNLISGIPVPSSVTELFK